MGTPYIFRKSFSLPNGGPQCIELDVPPRGVIRSIVIVEEVGVTDGFDFEIFTNRAVCPPTIDDEGSSVSSNSEAGSTPHKALFSLFGVLTAADEIFQEFGLRHPYETEGGSSNRSRKLYMQINPQGDGELAREYSMRLDIEGPDLSS